MENMETNQDRCPLCGDLIELDEYELTCRIPQYMKKHNLCFRCAFWKLRLEDDRELWRDNKVALITNEWDHYIIPKDSDLQMVTSSSGIYAEPLQPINHLLFIDPEKKIFKLMYNNHMPCQGIIPYHLRKFYQVNCRFLSKEEYENLSHHKDLTYEYCKNMIEKDII